MTRQRLQQIGSVALFLFAMAIFTTSCNRGVGCPNNFSLDQDVPTAQPHCD